MLYPKSRLSTSSDRQIGIPFADTEAKEVIGGVDPLVPMPTKSVEYRKVVGYVPLNFMLISAGYMFPWTAICSKVSFYTAYYGKNYFCILNILFYSSGLPISLLASWYDASVEKKYKSKFTFLTRTIICLTFIMGLLLCIPFSNSTQIAVIIFCLGVFTWSVHGSFSKLAALVQFNSNIYQQIGFVLPAFFSLILNLTLSSPEFYTCFAYFAVIGLCVFVAMISSIVLLRSNLLTLKFVEKDRQR
jgi:hypothetical protein